MSTDWFRQARWGVFNHYLDSAAGSTTVSPTTAQEWNRRVESFDIERLAKQLESVGAAYYFITLGQNSGHFCSPNATYDSFVGIEPSKCSRRDLVADLYQALAPRGIKLMVYLPSGAPEFDPVAVEKLEWRRGAFRLAKFQEKWEAVIREWSLRWGDKVSGWWVDGAFYADAMYRHEEAPNFASFADAMKAGNANAIVAFNPSIEVPIVSMTEHEDYTAGEIDRALPVGLWTGTEFTPLPNNVEGKQYHILTFLGEFWGRGEPRFPDELVVGYTKLINSRGGVITWDVPVSDDGEIPAAYMRQLRLLGAAKAD